MKFLRRFLVGLGAVIVSYGILAYIFMWPPVVTPLGHASAVSSCIDNLRQIDGAINEWALENGKHNGDPVTFEDIKPYIKLNSSGEIPSCPVGGKYTITVVGQKPTCSLGTNQSPRIRVRVDYFYWKWSETNGVDHRVPD
jgi:general secretion pathway protein G